MSTINDGGPAFPASEFEGMDNGSSGMSLRDYFAAKVMQAAVWPWYEGSPSKDDFMGIAKHAYAVADAMLAERAKGAQ